MMAVSLSHAHDRAAGPKCTLKIHSAQNDSAGASQIALEEDSCTLGWTGALCFQGGQCEDIASVVVV